MNIKLLHKKLIHKKLTISVAESCTGGLLANNFTRLSNASKYFQIGLITYSNKSKINILKVNKKDTMGELTQKKADEIFRDINIIVNGFYTMNRLAYWSLRLGGFVAWNGHRKRNSKIPGVK